MLIVGIVALVGMVAASGVVSTHRHLRLATSVISPATMLETAPKAAAATEPPPVPQAHATSATRGAIWLATASRTRTPVVRAVVVVVATFVAALVRDFVGELAMLALRSLSHTDSNRIRRGR